MEITDNHQIGADASPSSQAAGIDYQGTGETSKISSEDEKDGEESESPVKDGDNHDIAGSVVYSDIDSEDNELIKGYSSRAMQRAISESSNDEGGNGASLEASGDRHIMGSLVAYSISSSEDHEGGSDKSSEISRDDKTSGKGKDREIPKKDESISEQGAAAGFISDLEEAGHSRSNSRKTNSDNGEMEDFESEDCMSYSLLKEHLKNGKLCV